MLLKPSERVAPKGTMRSKSKKKQSSSNDWVMEHILAHDQFIKAIHEELLTAS
jgi:hypothetical protein